MDDDAGLDSGTAERADSLAEQASPSQRPTATVTDKAAPPLQHPTGPPGPRLQGWHYTFSSLKHRNFLYLWLGMLFSMGGIQMQMIARGYLTYDITQSAFILGVVNAGFALPMLAFALFGGAIADRIERRRIIQVGQAAVGLIALFVGISITSDTVTWYHLLTASVLQGAVFSFLMPARQALIPQLVGRDMLTNAMALNSAAMSTTTLIAPSIAGVIYAWVGPAVVYYVIAGTAVVAVFLTGMISGVGSGPAKSPAPMLTDIKAGLSYILRSPLVFVLLVMGLATTLFAMPFRFLMPIFVVDIYGRGPDALGLLVTIIGLGSLVGSLWVASLGRWKRGFLLIISGFVSAAGLMLVAAIPLYFAAAGFMVILGLGDAARRTLNMALIMEVTEDQYRGRVMSVFMMNFGLMPLGVLPAGIIAQILGGRWAIGLLAMMLFLTSVVILVTQKRLREFQ